ncbi:hypothetical protein IQ06DRAFT_295915 [Phaeosphaeriaceae sp. SRC1lsM3a]|nr:hypothetical protein IQ06DRAFT_295915 [Stagonospora sp. SRC1lsM3a]
MMQWPLDLSKKASKELPSIWMNGRGAILEASYSHDSSSAAFRVTNRHARLNYREVDTTGYQMIADVSRMPKPMPWTPSGPSLLQVWESLRSRYWYDHTVRGPQPDAD